MTYHHDLLIESHDATPVHVVQRFLEEQGKAYAPVYAPDGKYVKPANGLAQIIWEECNRYPGHVVHYAATIAQMVHETAGFQSRYWLERWNPGGIGAVNHDPNLAIHFPDARAGIRAHIAHLLVYSSGDGAWVGDDPRYKAVKNKGWLGAAKKWTDLNGKWAWPGSTYGQIIIGIANKIPITGGDVKAQIPGFTWHPADKDHYTRGRTAKISGGAQHYTAGKNSLAWLTTTSPPSNPVSVHFLIKHNPTMEDRGWQLVAIEDTAWTTAFANPYTVAIEYEHDGTEAIPDIAYEVMGQTWADITEYVKRKKLGSIEKVEGHKVWVGNPTLICPDGIDMDRVNREWKKRSLPSPITTGDPVTGKWVHEAFQSAYDTGGIYICGRPITGGFMEEHEGKPRLTQYFERVVMRHFPENSGEWQVQFDLLGSVELKRRYPNGEQPA